MRLVLVALAAALLLPAAASAKIIEVGDIGADAAAQLPDQPVRGGLAHDRLPGPRRQASAGCSSRRRPAGSSPGRSRSARPKPKQRKFFEENLGGAAQAGITVLKQGDRRYGRVTAASPVQTLTPYFGQTVQFPLEHVARDRARATSWRSPCRPGRRRSASAWGATASGARAGTRTPATTPRPRARRPTCSDLTQYRCAYRTARLTYSATLITTPVPAEAKDRSLSRPRPSRSSSASTTAGSNCVPARARSSATASACPSAGR